MRKCVVAAVSVRRPRRRARTVLALALALGAAAGATAVLVGVRTTGAPRAMTIEIDSIPEGVTPVGIAGRAAILRRRGDDVVVFVGSSPHLVDLLQWCDDAQAFVDIPGESVFDPNGVRQRGPSPRSLDRFASSREADNLVVDTTRIEYRDTNGNAMELPAAEPTRQLPAYTEEWEATFRSPPTWCPRW